MPSYEQSKSSKLWSVRFREIGEDGKEHNRRLSGFKTKRLAQFGYEDHIAEQKEKQKALPAPPASPDDMLFEDLVQKFYIYLSSRNKESALYSTQSKINNRIVPYFKGRKLSEIKPATVLEWQRTLEGYSSQYIRTLFSLLGYIYTYGYKYHDVTNTMAKVDRPRDLDPKKEMQFWTLEEFEAFIAEVPSLMYRAYFLTLYLTGCRRGEGAALSWEDVDLTRQTIPINKNVTSKTSEGAYKITTPKNKGSNRTVSIPSYLRDILAEYKNSLPKNVTAPRMFVFGGDRPPPTTSTDRTFAKACAAAGVKKIRIHDLRHSCASLLISKGVSIVAVSKRLGHTSIEQTLKTYTHLLPDDEQEMIDILENLGTGLGTKK